MTIKHTMILSQSLFSLQGWGQNTPLCTCYAGAFSLSYNPRPALFHLVPGKIYIYIILCVYMHMCVQAPLEDRRASDPLELEL